jgi:hypothetical protein
MSSELEIAGKVAEAINNKDGGALAALLHADVVLDGPFPLGTKEGAEKASKALVRVAKLGVKAAAPETKGDVISSIIDSPAGKMQLIYTIADGAVIRMDVASPD